MRRVLIAVLACLMAVILVCALFAPVSGAALWGGVDAALQMPDGATAHINDAMVEFVIGQFVLIRESRAGYRTAGILPVYVGPGVAIERFASVRVDGRLFSVGGRRGLWATSLAVYVDCRTGRAVPPLPDPLMAAAWRCLREVKQQDRSATTGDSVTLPDLPEPGNPEPLVAPSGTIAAAKVGQTVMTAQSAGGFTVASVPPQITGGNVELTGKIVAGVFYQSGSPQYIDFVYIEEPDRTNGIMVVPTSRSLGLAAISEGDVIDVSGEVVSGASSGECFIGSAAVTVTEPGTPPAPLCSSMRWTCGGVFGEQPALYVTPSVSGTGLSRVGTRITVCGKCLSTAMQGGYRVLHLDDGSGLARSTANGMKVVYYRPGDSPPDPVNQMITVTGILGAEKDGDNPVPVLRVPNARVIHVAPNGDDANDGCRWDTAKYSLQNAIDAADASVPKCEVWVAAATYTLCGNIDTKPGVSLYGGFVGTEGEREQRSWLLNPTVLHLPAGSINVQGSSGDPVVIDGFTIKGSPNAAVSCASPGFDVVIRHNTIKDNVTGVAINGSTDKEIRVTDNWLTGNTARAVFCSYTAPALLSIANNTIIHNSGASAIELLVSSPLIAGNIIAWNDYGLYSYGNTTPDIRCNCVYGNLFDYYGQDPPPSGNGNISDDPDLAGVHLLSSSPCRDAGYDATVQPGDTDIDEGTRATGDPARVDIGADEYAGHDAETATLSPEQVVVAPSNSTALTLHVWDEVIEQDVEGRRVDLSISAGSIVSISPDGHVTSATSGWGTTDSNGNVTVTVSTPSEEQKMIVTARAWLPTGRAVRKSVLYPRLYRVGLLYGLTWEYVGWYIENYLQRVDEKQVDVVYERIGDISSGIDSTFNTVFLSLPWPNRPLNTAELNALSAFVQSGRDKRVVLLGEYNTADSSEYGLFNGYLNTVAAGIGMSARFSTAPDFEGDGAYDNGPNRCRLCPVNSDHYLMPGVRSLWDGATDTFVDGWDSYARPVAYMNSNPTWPWVLEEDTVTAGSRIAIHDSSMMNTEYYAQEYDTIPDRNFLFTYNLCTVFPQ